ncbi:hypothetical protein OUY22_02810 [Nonomuraea sp. MCN248]|uniref:DUF348 domain-containing protein n=1 Tax=Nonomuraea corallina TaxID=2989783 RepID=A0ABT4S578_9ACTN|nr:hypothetical protein [Nonomuraea corallina]MDA0632331.1 hypothetical protein [Nonomuraea corallina]
MNANERANLARALPPGRELPERREQQIKDFVMAEIHRSAEPARPRLRLPRPMLVLPVAAAAMALVIAFGLGLGGAPAYAITLLDDGTIHVTLNEIRDADGLEADLRDLGVNAVVDYVPDGQRCSPQPRSTDLLPQEEARLGVWPPPQNPAGDGFTIDPAVVGPGQTAVIELSISDDERIASIWARVSNGPVAACELVVDPDHHLGPAPQS